MSADSAVLDPSQKSSEELRAQMHGIGRAARAASAQLALASGADKVKALRAAGLPETARDRESVG